ncbi:MAG: precorrin-3B synthase [Hyphomicrobiales bacterium]|nr:precorrin-3B synthase [Hyphomicrobiales bacterium]MDE2114718.1 precorrin-3B synthase [Hyphomicrobiales bacterium]
MTGFGHRGACPTTLVPMRSGDGLLMRLHLAGGVLALPKAQAIALAAQRFGNGQIDLSQRGNLQIRGLSEASFAEIVPFLRANDLIAAAVENGDGAPLREIQTRVLISPLNSLSPELVALAPLAHALEQQLHLAPRQRPLSPKFSIIIEDGGPLNLAHIDADLRFIALPGEAPLKFAGYFDGVAAPVCIIPAHDLVPTALSMLDAFLASRRADGQAPARMREVSGHMAPLWRASHPQDWDAAQLPSPQPHDPADLIGAFRPDAFGLGLPFGRIHAQSLLQLHAAASAIQAKALYLTPWRVLVVPLTRKEDAIALKAALSGESFIFERRDPRLKLTACVGAPACTSALQPTARDAETIANALSTHWPEHSMQLHISGCPKGCAHPKAAPFTLVAQASGYGLILNGRATDAPQASFKSLESAIHGIASKLNGDAPFV